MELFERDLTKKLLIARGIDWFILLTNLSKDASKPDLNGCLINFANLKDLITLSK